MGVLLTGMGDDGATGLLEMKRARRATVAQDDARRSCSACRRKRSSGGARTGLLPLPSVAAAILSAARPSAR